MRPPESFCLFSSSNVVWLQLLCGWWTSLSFLRKCWMCILKEILPRCIFFVDTSHFDGMVFLWRLSEKDYLNAPFLPSSPMPSVASNDNETIFFVFFCFYFLWFFLTWCVIDIPRVSMAAPQNRFRGYNYVHWFIVLWWCLFFHIHFGNARL